MSRKKSAQKVPVVKIPDGVTPVPTRTAATILNCSMGHVRWLRRTGKLKSWKFGTRYAMVDLAEVNALAKAYALQRREGKKIGAPSQGFSPDT